MDKTSQKDAKERVRQQREVKHETRTKDRRFDRNLKDVQLVPPGRRDDGSSVTSVNEGMLDLPRVSPSHRVARGEVAARVAVLMSRSWRRNMIVFLCCWRLGKLQLTRDVVRYVCSFLRPTLWTVTESGLRNLRSGELRVWPLPPFADFKPETHAFDAQEREVWLWGQLGQICIFSLKDGEWRVVKNRELLEAHAAGFENRMNRQHTGYRLRYVFFGDLLLAYEGSDRYSDEMLFSSENPRRTLTQVAVPIPKYCRYRASMYTVLVGSCLFLFALAEECTMYPSVLQPDACCWECGGSMWKRVQKPVNCCALLQVLFLNDLGYGWTVLLPPPVHYRVAPEFYASPDRMQLVMNGGTVALGLGQLYNPNDKEGKVGGRYVLDLSRSKSKWEFVKEELPPHIDYFEDA